MLTIQQKILSLTGNDVITRTKIHIIRLIYDDIFELKKQGIKEPAIHKLISNEKTKFSISYNLLRLYIVKIRKARESENTGKNKPEDPTKITNDWNRVGITYEPLIANLENAGYNVENVIEWGCYGDIEVQKKLFKIKN